MSTAPAAPGGTPIVARANGVRAPRADSPAAEELVETLVRLEPGARLVRLEPGTTSAVDPRWVRLVVPEGDRPVALTGAHVRHGAAVGRSADATTTVPEALGMLGGRMWTGLTGGGLLRDRVAVLGQGAGLADHLGEVLGRPVSYALTVDEARTSRRPVLRLFDERRRLFAYAALGVSPVSRLDLEAKAAALGVVGEREWKHLEVPHVVARTTWHGTDVLVTSTLQAPAWQGTRRRRAQAPVEAMAELSGAWATDPVRLDEMPWTAARQEIADGLTSRESRRRLGGALDRLLRDARRTTWPVGAWHGDWTAHHMARRGAKVQLWSWPRFEVGVPMGLDPCHFAVEATTDREGFTPDAIRSGLRESLRGQTGPSASVMGALYLLAVASRELVLVEGPGGHRVADRAEVLLTALEDWFDRG